MNAVKTGLTGRTVLLPGDDAALYEAHAARFIEHFQPAGPEEQNLAQSLADTEWRLLRIPALEAGIYALGRLELAELFPNEEQAVRSQLIEAKVFLTHQRQLNNLSIQENRLLRRREKDTAALRELQENRKRREKARLDEAARQYIVAVEEERNDEWEPDNLASNFHSSKSKSEPSNSTRISSMPGTNAIPTNSSPDFVAHASACRAELQFGNAAFRAARASKRSLDFRSLIADF